jgi:hypothetical protein
LSIILPVEILNVTAGSFAPTIEFDYPLPSYQAPHSRTIGSWDPTHLSTLAPTFRH